MTKHRIFPAVLAASIALGATACIPRPVPMGGHTGVSPCAVVFPSQDDGGSAAIDAYAEGVARLDYVGQQAPRTGGVWLSQDDQGDRWEIVAYALSEDSTAWNRKACIGR